MRFRVPALLLTLAACSPPPDAVEQQDVPITRATAAAPVHRGEDVPTPIALTWAEAPRSARAATSLTLVLKSFSASPLTASLTLVMTGLDDRTATRTVRSVSVAAGASSRVSVDLRSLELQSTTHSVQLMAIATFPHDGRTMTVQSEPVAYHFDRAFTQATVYSADEMISAFGGGVIDGSRPLEARVTDGGRTREIAAVIEEEANTRVQAARAQGRTLDASTALNVRAVAAPQVLFSPLPTPSAGTAGPTAGTVGPVGSAPDTYFCSGNCVTVCPSWQTAYVDLTDHEDYLVESNGTQKVEASYAAFVIEELPTCTGQYCSNIATKVAEGFLGSTGCVTANLEANKIHRITVRSEFRRNGVDSRVTYYSANNASSLVGITSFIKTFAVFDKFTQSKYTPALPYHASANAAAALSRVLTILKPDGEITVKAGIGCNDGVASGGVPATDACAGGGELATGPNTKPDGTPGMLRWKFVLTHELGHVYQSLAHAMPGGDYCFTSGYNAVEDCGFADPSAATNAVCRCDHVTGVNKLHCMQSLERDGIAQREGFAQFFSARAWNNPAGSDCHFNYYKQFNAFLFVGTIVVQPPVRLDCREIVKWRDAFCFAPNMSTEYDWMNFLWNVSSVGSNTSTIQELFDIWEVALTTSNAPTWNQLKSAASIYYGSSSPKYARFVNDGDKFGVDGDAY